MKVMHMILLLIYEIALIIIGSMTKDKDRKNMFDLLAGQTAIAIVIIGALG